jgi:hypothetical protein
VESFGLGPNQIIYSKENKLYGKGENLRNNMGIDCISTEVYS